MPVVQQPQVARAETVLDVEQLEVPADRKTVLNADQGNATAFIMYAAHVCRREGQTDPIRVIHVGHLADGRVLDESVGHRARVARRIALPLHYENDEEHRIQSAALHAGQIHLLPRRLRLSGIVRVGAEIERNVHVRVDRDDTLMHSLGPSQ